MQVNQQPQEFVSSSNVAMYDPRDETKRRKEIYRHVQSSGLSEKEVQLLAAMTLPTDAEPVRIGSNFGSRRTGVVNLRQPVNVAYPTSATLSDLPVDTTMAFKFKDPLRSVIYNRGLSSTESYTYLCEYILYASGAPVEAFPRYQESGFFRSTGAAAVHGPKLALGRIGRYDPHRWILCSNGCKMVVTIPAAAGSGDKFTLQLWRLVGSEPYLDRVSEFTTNGADQDINLTILSTNYYSWSISAATDIASPGVTMNSYVRVHGNGAASTSLQGSCWCQLTSPELNTVSDAIVSARVNSASLMYTNTSSQIARSGQTLMYQLPDESNWLSYTSYNTLMGFRDIGLIGAVMGGYLFHKPSDSTYKMHTLAYDPTNSELNQAKDFVFDLFPEQGPLVLATRVLDTTLTASNSAYWTFGSQVEFQTNAQWFETRSEIFSSNSLERCLTALSVIPQYHSNDFHLSDIWEGIKSFARDVWSGVKEVAPVVAPLLPLLLSPKKPPLPKPTEKDKPPKSSAVTETIKKAVPKPARRPTRLVRANGSA